MRLPCSINIKCYGSSKITEYTEYQGPVMPNWACKYLAEIVKNNANKGGLMLWHKWEKHSFTTRLTNRFVLNFV